MSSLKPKYRLALSLVLVFFCAPLVLAQIKTETTEQKAQPRYEVKVERGEVVYVSGNQVMVKMEDGQVKEFTVPDDATAIVDGRTVTIADLRPGMKLERTITTTTTEKTVKTVRSGTGTIVNIQAPNWVTVQFADNTVERLKIPAGAQFTVDGVKKTAFELRKGMRISATRVVENPTSEVNTARNVTGSAPPPPPPPPEIPKMEGPVLIVEAAPPTPMPVATSTALIEPAAPTSERTTLPKTGSVFPFIGFLGLVCVGASLSLRLLRQF